MALLGFSLLSSNHMLMILNSNHISVFLSLQCFCVFAHLLVAALWFCCHLPILRLLVLSKLDHKPRILGAVASGIYQLKVVSTPKGYITCIHSTFTLCLKKLSKSCHLPQNVEMPLNVTSCVCVAKLLQAKCSSFCRCAISWYSAFLISESLRE